MRDRYDVVAVQQSRFRVGLILKDIQTGPARMADSGTASGNKQPAKWAPKPHTSVLARSNC